MSYDSGTVRTALELLRELLKQPTVNRDNNSNLMTSIQRDPEVINLWEEIVEPTFGIKLLNSGREYYLTTGIEDSIFAMDNEDMRKALKLADNTELYTCSFIVLVMVASFFNSDDTSEVSREYINIIELEETITADFQAILKHENIEAFEKENRINLGKPAEYWLDLPVWKEDAAKPSMTNTRHGLILKTMNYLQKNELVRVIENRQIFPDRRLAECVADYYSLREHKNAILALIASGGNDDAAN